MQILGRKLTCKVSFILRINWTRKTLNKTCPRPGKGLHLENMLKMTENDYEQNGRSINYQVAFACKCLFLGEKFGDILLEWSYTM